MTTGPFDGFYQLAHVTDDLDHALDRFARIAKPHRHRSTQPHLNSSKRIPCSEFSETRTAALIINNGDIYYDPLAIGPPVADGQQVRPDCHSARGSAAGQCELDEPEPDKVPGSRADAMVAFGIVDRSPTIRR